MRNWSDDSRKAHSGAEIVDVIGVDVPLGNSAQKRATHEATGAGIADMEFDIVARVAWRMACLSRSAGLWPIRPTDLAAGRAVGMRVDGSIDYGRGAPFLHSRGRASFRLSFGWRVIRRPPFRALFSGREVLGPSFGVLILATSVLDVPGKDEFGRPLSVERDVGRHRPFGAQPRSATFERLDRDGSWRR